MRVGSECIFKSAPPSPWAEAEAAAGGTGKGVTAPARAWGVRDPDSGRGSGGDPGLGGRGLAGSAPLGHRRELPPPPDGLGGWAEPSGARAGRARSPPRHRQSPAVERDAPPTPELRLQGKHAWAVPREDRGPLVWGGGVRGIQACPRLAPPRSLKAGAAPGSCAGLSRTQLLYSGLPRSGGDNVDWRYPLFTARPGSPPGQLGFRRS